MFKKYALTLVTQVTSWIGVAIIFSIMFLPSSVVVMLGLFLIFTPDEKINSMVINWLPKVKKILENN